MHNNSFRRRLEKEMTEMDKVKRAKRRMDEYVEKEMAKGEKIRNEKAAKAEGRNDAEQTRDEENEGHAEDRTRERGEFEEDQEVDKAQSASDLEEPDRAGRSGLRDKSLIATKLESRPSAASSGEAVKVTKCEDVKVERTKRKVDEEEIVQEKTRKCLRKLEKSEREEKRKREAEEEDHDSDKRRIWTLSWGRLDGVRRLSSWWASWICLNSRPWRKH